MKTNKEIIDLVKVKGVHWKEKGRWENNKWIEPTVIFYPEKVCWKKKKGSLSNIKWIVKGELIKIWEEKWK